MDNCDFFRRDLGQQWTLSARQRIDGGIGDLSGSRLVCGKFEEHCFNLPNVAAGS